MPRKPVSLGGTRRDRVKAGHEDATPERLHQAMRDGYARVDGQGVRRVGDPFDALCARALLDRRNPDTNALLWQAGDRLRGHWHRGRLDNLTAFDFRRDAVDGGGGGIGTSPTEAALRHRDTFRAAVDVIGPRLAPYVTGVVIDARPVADLRGLVGDTSHARTAEAIVVERLREGLHRLCDLWRLHPDPRGRPIRAWHDDSRPSG